MTAKTIIKKIIPSCILLSVLAVIIFSQRGTGSARSSLLSDSVVPVDSSFASQTFICDEDSIAGITVRFSQNHSSDWGDPVSVTLEGDDLQASWLIDAPMLSTGQVDLYLDEPVEGTEGKTYTLTASCGGVSGLFLSTTREQHYDAQLFSLNGNEVEGGYASFQVIKSRINKSAYFAVFSVVLILTLTVLSFLLKKNVKTHLIFLFLWSVISLLSLMSAVPMNTPDECPHFLRAFEISCGRPTPVMTTDADGNSGRLLPSAIDEFYKSFLNVNEPRFSDLEAASKVRVDRSSLKLYPAYYTPLYFPTDYAPQALGIAAASLFSDRVLVLWYASRIMNTIWTGLLLTLAIWLVPYKKELFSVLALLPVFLQETWGSSPDAGTTAYCLLLLAEVLWLCENEGNVKKKPLVTALLFITMAAVSLSKIIYAPICLIFIFVPDSFFGSKRKKLIWIIFATIMVMLLGLTDLMYASGYDIQLVDGVDPDMQKAYILSHPLHFLDAMIEAFHSMTPKLFGELFNMKGGAVVQLTTPVVTACLSLLAFLSAFVLLDSRGPSFPMRMVFAGLFLAVTLLLNAAEYVAWTPLRAISVYGLQTRYYLPALPLLLLSVSPPASGETSQKRGFPLYAVAAGDILLLASFFIQTV